MPISPQDACDLFADLTRGALVPMDPGELLRGPGVHDHVFVGDRAVRCFKHEKRWMYEEEDVRCAGQALAGLRWERGDVAIVQLPAYREGERRPEEWFRVNWRQRLTTGMFTAARQKALAEGPCPRVEGLGWKRIGANGLPGGLTWEEFITSCHRHRSSQYMAGTRPLELLTYSGYEWLLPRPYLDLLDRWEQQENILVARARLCCMCGAQGPAWGEWRRPTRSGSVTRCPPCSAALFPPYTGHLRGVLYSSPRRRRARAEEYLCALCGQCQAWGWDHCHDHGYVRGPLCSRCNTLEGGGHGDDFLRQEGGLRLLLECCGCREERTLPRRFHTAAVCRYLEETECHGDCLHPPHAEAVRQGGQGRGALQFILRCSQHSLGWAREVPLGEIAALVSAFVDTAEHPRE